MSRLGLRARLAAALAGIAVAAVALATVLSNAGLGRELDRSAEQRLETAATHLGEVAAQIYVRDSAWTREGRTELMHLAEVEGLRARVDGVRFRGPLATTAPIVVEGRRVGTLAVAAADPAAFRELDEDLHDRLNRLHVLAGVLAMALGLLAALVVSVPLARPIRRLTVGARRMEQGALETRVEPTGGPELERLAQALNRLAGTLQREELLRREATADLAHELRTPLTGILSRIEAAQDGVLADEAANLEAMHAEALRLRRLIEDLARLADAQQLGVLEDREPVSLDAIAAERAGAFAETAAARGVSLETDLHPVRVLGRRPRIEQILDNLLSNSLRYTDTGGRVVVRTRADTGQALLEVVDTGIGLAPEELPHVFERFWRSDKSRARTRGGAGIGLAIVQELVRAHDGHVEVASRPGEGSTFAVRLPLAPAPG